MTCHTLLGGWRSGLPRLGNFIVAAAAVPVKSLLGIQDHGFSRAFNLDLRQRRQQFWLFLRPRMTVVAHGHRRRAGILL